MNISNSLLRLLMRQRGLFLVILVVTAQNALAMACFRYIVNGAPVAVEAGPFEKIHQFEVVPGMRNDQIAALQRLHFDTEHALRDQYAAMNGKDGWRLLTDEDIHVNHKEVLTGQRVKGYFVTMGPLMEFFRIVEYEGTVSSFVISPDSDQSRPFFDAVITRNGVSEIIPFSLTRKLLIKK
jgi:hypothetical protein